MAAEYHLTCVSCKEFIDIHKLKLVDNILPSETCKIDVAKIQQRLAELKKEYDDKDGGQWIRNLLPFIHGFLAQHDNHKIILLDGLGDCFLGPRIFRLLRLERSGFKLSDGIVFAKKPCR
jgi:hypothetical protein